jgi:hypothetical protein
MFTFIKTKDIVSGYQPDNDVCMEEMHISDNKTAREALAELNRVSLEEFPQIIQTFNEWLKDDKIYTQTNFHKQVRKTSPLYDGSIGYYLCNERHLAINYDEDDVQSIEDAYEKFYHFTKNIRARWSIIKLAQDKYVIAKPFYTTKYQIKFDKDFIRLMIQMCKDQIKKINESLNGAE